MLTLIQEASIITAVETTLTTGFHRTVVDASHRALEAENVLKRYHDLCRPSPPDMLGVSVFDFLYIMLQESVLTGGQCYVASAIVTCYSVCECGPYMLENLALSWVYWLLLPRKCSVALLCLSLIFLVSVLNNGMARKQVLYHRNEDKPSSPTYPLPSQQEWQVGALYYGGFIAVYNGHEKICERDGYKCVISKATTSWIRYKSACSSKDGGVVYPAQCVRIIPLSFLGVNLFSRTDDVR